MHHAHEDHDISSSKIDDSNINLVRNSKDSKKRKGSYDLDASNMNNADDVSTERTKATKAPKETSPPSLILDNTKDQSKEL